jgi:hypothetical protein
MKLSPYLVALGALVACAALAGCSRETSATAKQPAAKAALKSPATAAAKIARIVFVDKEKCCKCTRERIDKSWKVVTDVLGFPPSIDVERLHMDSQADKAAPYIKQRAIMVPPALYFYDAKGTLVEVLQGELKPDKLRAAARL